MKGELINMTRAWDKEISEFPDRNRTHDLPNTWRSIHCSRRTVDRTPAMCSVGHGFHSCQGIRSFFVQRLCHFDQFSFHEYIYGKLNVKHKQEETSRTYRQYQTKYVLDNLRMSCKTVSKQNAWIIVRSIYSLGGWLQNEGKWWLHKWSCNSEIWKFLLVYA